LFSPPPQVHLNVHHYWHNATPPVSSSWDSAITTRRPTAITIDTSLFRPLEEIRKRCPTWQIVCTFHIRGNVGKTLQISTIKIIWRVPRILTLRILISLRIQSLNWCNQNIHPSLFFFFKVGCYVWNDR
jgi:hypothetical protein